MISNNRNKYKTSVLMLTITKISIITKIIIPLFNKYPILGVKYLDYLDWCKIANLISEGKHLTNEGLKLIKEIKSGTGKASSCRHLCFWDCILTFAFSSNAKVQIIT